MGIPYVADDHVDCDRYFVDHDHIDWSFRSVDDRYFDSDYTDPRDHDGNPDWDRDYTDRDYYPNENLECLESFYRISVIIFLLISAR